MVKVVLFFSLHAQIFVSVRESSRVYRCVCGAVVECGRLCVMYPECRHSAMNGMEYGEKTFCDCFDSMFQICLLLGEWKIELKANAKGKWLQMPYTMLCIQKTLATVDRKTTADNSFPYYYCRSLLPWRRSSADAPRHDKSKINLHFI